MDMSRKYTSYGDAYQYELYFWICSGDAIYMDYATRSVSYKLYYFFSMMRSKNWMSDSPDCIFFIPDCSTPYGIFWK